MASSGRPDNYVFVAVRSTVNQVISEFNMLLDANTFTVLVAPPLTNIPKRVEYFRALDSNRAISTPDDPTTKARSYVIVISWEQLKKEWLEWKNSPGFPNQPEIPHSLFSNRLRLSTVFFDEAQNAVNPMKDNQRAAILLGQHARSSWAVTGTPLPNGPPDLLNMLRIAKYPLKQELAGRITSIAQSVRGKSRNPSDNRSRVEQSYPKTVYHPSLIDAVYAYNKMERTRHSLQKLITEHRKGIPESVRLWQEDPANQNKVIHDTHWIIVNGLMMWKDETSKSISNKWQVNQGAIHDQVLKPFIALAMPCLYRRNKRTILPYLQLAIHPFPEPVEEEIRVQLGEHERRYYQALKGDSQDDQIPTGFQPTLRVACLDAHSSLFHYPDLRNPAPAKIKAAAAKIKETLERNKEKVKHDREKILIYVHWSKIIPALVLHFARLGVHVSQVSGQSTTKERTIKYAEFQSIEPHPSQVCYGPDPADESNYKVYDSVPCYAMIITDASSTGVNLQRANHIHMLDQTWSDHKRAQAHGRSDRVGQTRQVYIYVYIADGTTDDYLKGVMDKKKGYAELMDRNTPAASQSAPAASENQDGEVVAGATSALTTSGPSTSETGATSALSSHPIIPELPKNGPGYSDRKKVERRQQRMEEEDRETMEEHDRRLLDDDRDMGEENEDEPIVAPSVKPLLPPIPPSLLDRKLVKAIEINPIRRLRIATSRETYQINEPNGINCPPPESTPRSEAQLVALEQEHEEYSHPNGPSEDPYHVPLTGDFDDIAKYLWTLVSSQLEDLGHRSRESNTPSPQAPPISRMASRSKEERTRAELEDLTNRVRAFFIRLREHSISLVSVQKLLASLQKRSLSPVQRTQRATVSLFGLQTVLLIGQLTNCEGRLSRPESTFKANQDMPWITSDDRQLKLTTTSWSKQRLSVPEFPWEKFNREPSRSDEMLFFGMKVEQQTQLDAFENEQKMKKATRAEKRKERMNDGHKTGETTTWRDLVTGDGDPEEEEGEGEEEQEEQEEPVEDRGGNTRKRSGATSAQSKRRSEQEGGPQGKRARTNKGDENASSGSKRKSAPSASDSDDTVVPTVSKRTKTVNHTRIIEPEPGKLRNLFHQSMLIVSS